MWRLYDGICPTLKICFSLVIHVIATGSNINMDVPDELLNFDSQNLYCILILPRKAPSA